MTNKPFSKLLWLKMDSSYENMQFLLKYFPKYYTNTEYEIHELQDPRVFHRTKCLKYIRSVNIKSYTTSNKFYILKAFKKHKGHITSFIVQDKSIVSWFPKVSEFTINTQDLSSWKSLLRFLKINKLTLEFSGNYEVPKSENTIRYFHEAFWRHLVKLRELKSLHLKFSNSHEKELDQFLTKLNTLEYFLGSLNKLEISLNHLEIPKPFVFAFPNIFNYMTSFKANEVSSVSLENILENITTFKSLTSLQIIKTSRALNDQGGNKYTFLRDLEHLEKLKSLKISVNLNSFQHFQNFLENFSLPKSLISLKLGFLEILWTNILSPKSHENTMKENPFEGIKICQRFYSQWENLHKLSQLSLCFTEVDNSSRTALYFSAPIFKKLQKLQALSFSNWSSLKNVKKKPIDFNQLYSSISHLFSTLKCLQVDSYAISIRNFTFFENLNKPNLYEFNLSGFILGDTNLKELYKLIPRNKEISSSCIIDDFQPQKSLEFDRIIVDNEDSFISLLQDLQYIPHYANVTLNFDVRKIPSEKFITNLSRVIPQIKRKRLARITFSHLSAVSTMKFGILCRLLCENPKFQNLVILDRLENELYNYETAIALVEIENKVVLEYSHLEIEEAEALENALSSDSENEEPQNDIDDELYPEYLTQDFLEDIEENL